MRPITVTVDSQSISQPVPVNWRGNNSFEMSLAVEKSGILTYSAQHTFDSPTDFESATDYNDNAFWIDTSGLSNLTDSAESNIAFPVRAVRLNVLAYTNGEAKLTIIQAT